MTASDDSKRTIGRRVKILAVILIIVDVFLLVHYVQDAHRRQAVIKTQQSAPGGKKIPSSTKPSSGAVASYQVAPDLPKYLIIPAINIDARIFKLSTDPQGQIAAPDNIHDVGWYSSSSTPGQPGAMFIDGHVSGWKANGVFYDLYKLQPGSTIQLVRGDNKVFTYVVRHTQTYDVASVNMGQVLATIKPGTPGLNLMTCSGSLDAGTGEFNKRLVVYSVLRP